MNYDIERSLIRDMFETLANFHSPPAVGTVA